MEKQHVTKQALETLSRHRRIIRSFEARARSREHWSEQLAERITTYTGSIAFLLLNISVFIGWIIVHSGLIPGIVPFDPFPYGFLTTFVSLEAIILSIFVLLNQNRTERIDSLRSELALQIELISEEEITKVLAMLVEINKKLGIPMSDAELETMLKRPDTSYILQRLEKQITEEDRHIL